MTTRVTTNFTQTAGQELTGLNEDAFGVSGNGWTSVVLNGRVTVTSPTNAVAVIGIRASDDGITGGGQMRTVTVTGTASVSVTSSPMGGYAAGIASGGTFGRNIRIVNQGVIDVRTNGEAGGVGFGSGGLDNQGTITVTAPSSADGVSCDDTTRFTNSGTITVTGGSGVFQGATAVRIYNSHGQGEIINNGTIRATVIAAPAKSVGVLLAGYTTLTNTGLIEADTALLLARDGILSGQGRNSLVTNSGTLKGAVILNNTAGEPVVLRNSGVILGDVDLNTGADTYNGVGGTVSGPVHGESGTDSLLGGSGAESLSGDAGDDTIDGGAGGADVLDGGAGGDVLSFAGSAMGVNLDITAQTVSGGAQFRNFETYAGSERDDTILGSATADLLYGLGGADTINGGAGDDRIIGGDGVSYLRGDDGNDSLLGGAAFDDINGNMGNDTVATGAGEDYCVGGKDNDSLSGGADYDLVYGNIGADTCMGDDGNDIVRGGQDNDVVNGGAGNDFVSGDKGDDTMTGGVGADIFHTFGDAGLDRVTDFNAAQGDRVQLDPGTTYTLSQVGFDTVIDMAGGGRMVLLEVSFASLAPGWIFVG